MNITQSSLSKPYGVIALTLVIVALGLFAFFRTPTDLFPDTSPPQVSVITVEPGASSNDIADKITQIVEKELNTITGLKRIRSTSRDEVASVVAEFYYTKPIGEAVTDVQNAVARIRARLPRDILEPMIYRITDATRPLLTLALSPKEGSPKDLSVVRLLAENEIMDALLRVPGVGDVDVFGAHKPEVQVRVDRDKLAAQGTTLGQVLGQIKKQNVAAPAGTIYTKTGEYLVRVEGEFQNLDDLRNLPIARSRAGRVLLSDIAEVRLAQHEPRSGYFGNGREAIAVNVMRPEGGETVSAIKHLKKELKRLEARYPDIRFDITSDQQPIIDINTSGMRESVYQAILLTVLVILIFLGDVRAAFVISLSIPLAFLSALAVLWFSPYTLNMVTLSGLVIAIGIVVDASIVVLENVFRKRKEHPDWSTKKATLEGTTEITHGITGGVLTTVIVLIPVMFAGGYTQQVMRPLNLMITSTILSSLLVAVTVIPLVAAHMLNKQVPRIFLPVNRVLKPFTHWLERRTEDMARVTRFCLRHRAWTVAITLIFFIFTMRVVAPLNGKELMPPMDTGIGIISFDTPTHYTPKQVQQVSRDVEKMVRDTSEGLQLVSTVSGSEPGQISFGGGGATAQSVNMTITLVDRKHRKASIWDMESRWREGLRKVSGVRTFHVTEFGATPLSTTKAPLDIVLSGPDPNILNRLADEVMGRLRGVKGLTDVRRSWYIDKQEQNIVVDPDLARFYGMNPSDVAGILKVAVKGVPASQMRLQGALDIPITVQYRQKQIDERRKLEDIPLLTPDGPVPLRALSKISTVKAAPFVTRENQYNTIDITGINSGQTISQVGQQVKMRLRKLKLPDDYEMKISGTLDDMKTGNAEMGRALLIGIVLLYILLVAMYNSFSQPLIIMSSILISIAAAMLGLLIFNKPMCKPAMMGLILVAGTVVNNVILLIDFMNDARKQGMSVDEAIIESVRRRFRPILMTAVAASIGLTPLVFEMAVGMERLSPLGIVAAAGLIVGVFGSIWVSPVIYSLLDSAAKRLRGTRPPATMALLLAVGLTLFSVAPASAAELDSSVVMTIEQAVDYALKHSPDLSIAASDVNAARGEQLSARAELLPQVDLVGGVSHSGLDHPVTPGLLPAKVRFSDTLYQGGVQVSQLLWDFGQTWNRMQAVRKQTMAAANTLARRREEVVFGIIALYHQRVMVDDLIHAALATKKSLETLDFNILARVKSGKASQLDQLKVRVRLAEVKSQIAALEAQRISTQSALLAAMGYEGPPVAWASSGADKIIKIEELKASELVNAAMVNRRDLRAQNNRVTAFEAARRAAKRSRWPRVTLFGNYAQYNGDNPVPGSPAGNASDAWEDDYTVGGMLYFPLFDSGLRSGQIAAARARHERAEAVHKGLRLRIRKEVRSAVAELQSARSRVDAFKQSIDEARHALHDEHLKYEAGKSTINDVLDAEAVLLNSDSQYSRARHEQKIAWYNLQLVVGRPLDTWMAKNSREQPGPARKPEKKLKHL